MGRLIQNDIIENNIQGYIERATSNYTTLLESSPIFGTYYHQNDIFSTTDPGLENIEDDLGRDSPLKFEKILNFPFYGSDTMSPQIERGDVGLNTNFEGEFIILPNTIKPYPNDYFTLQSVGEKYYFKVTEVQQDMIKSKPFYRINYKFTKIESGDSFSKLENHVIEEYQTIYDNIGTNNSCIIKSSVFTSLDYMNKLKNKLIKFYINTYYDKLNNVIILKNNTLDVQIYNKYLNKFIIDNDLFYDKKEYYSTVKLVEYLPIDSVFEATYQKTIYYAIESQDCSQFVGRFFSFMDVNYPHATWFRSNLDYKDLLILNDDEELLKHGNVMEYLGKEFYGRIKLNIPFTSDEDYYMENMIIRYLQGNSELPSKELLDHINNTIWRKDMRSYIFIPLILYIFKKYEDTEIKRF